MVSSLVVLGKVGMVCGIGLVVSTGFEWISDLEIKPKNRTIKLGGEGNKGEVDTNDVKTEHLGKKARQQS